MQKSDLYIDHLPKTHKIQDPTHFDHHGNHAGHEHAFHHHHHLYPSEVYEHDILHDLKKEGYWGDEKYQEDDTTNDNLTEQGCNKFQHEIISELESEGLL